VLSSFFVAALVLLATVDSLKCGKIWDGNTRSVEYDTTRSLTRLTANWRGFQSSSDEVVHYQYAIVSQNQASSEILASGASAKTSQRCRSDSGLAPGVMPDTVWFRHLPDGAEEIEKFKMILVKGMKYYFILRASNEDESQILFTNSNGITAGTNGTVIFPKKKSGGY